SLCARWIGRGLLHYRVRLRRYLASARWSRTGSRRAGPRTLAPPHRLPDARTASRSHGRGTKPRGRSDVAALFEPAPVFLRDFLTNMPHGERPVSKIGSEWRSQMRLSAGAPGRSRTCDPRIRSPMLYPTELQAHQVVTIHQRRAKWR